MINNIKNSDVNKLHEQEKQLKKELSQALFTACNSIFTYNHNKKLNEDCWKGILAYLPQDALKNLTQVSALFFKKPSCNDNVNKMMQPQFGLRC